MLADALKVNQSLQNLRSAADHEFSTMSTWYKYMPWNFFLNFDHN